MPHSSGGGRSHGGSHRSSRSSKNSAANMRFGRSYYPGANRYVYYRAGMPQYYFSDRPYTLQNARSEKIKQFFTSIISIILAAIFGFSGYRSLPQKVKMDYNTEILISDTARLLSDTEEAEMNEAFLSFQNKTGVTPAFFTINIKELKTKGGDLQDYVYKLYVDTFNDEKHWLVVYCVDNVEKNWSWEGMIGDNCGSMITTDLENEFTRQLQSNLMDNSKSLSASVIDAFNQIGQKAGKISGNKIPTLIFLFAGGGLLLFTAVKKIIGTTKQKPEDDPRINATQCPVAETEPETIKCDYCGNEFVAKLHTTCPHCGAPLENNWE